MTAIVQNGMLKTDKTSVFPEVAIEIVEEEIHRVNEAIQAWNKLQKSIDEHPIIGLAGMFKSRDEIHERH